MGPLPPAVYGCYPLDLRREHRIQWSQQTQPFPQNCQAMLSLKAGPSQGLSLSLGKAELCPGPWPLAPDPYDDSTPFKRIKCASFFIASSENKRELSSVCAWWGLGNSPSTAAYGCLNGCAQLFRVQRISSPLQHTSIHCHPNGACSHGYYLIPATLLPGTAVPFNFCHSHSVRRIGGFCAELKSHSWGRQAIPGPQRGQSNPLRGE